MTRRPEDTRPSAPELPPDEGVGAAPAAPPAGAVLRVRSLAGVGVVASAFPLDFREADVVEVPAAVALAACEAFPGSFVIDSPSPPR